MPVVPAPLVSDGPIIVVCLLVLRQAGSQAKEACGNFNLCAGLEAPACGEDDVPRVHVGPLRDDVPVAVRIDIQEACARSHATAITHSGLLGNVTEGFVTIVAIQTVGCVRKNTPFGIADAFQIRTIEHVEVQIIIAIIVHCRSKHAIILIFILFMTLGAAFL